MLTSSGFHEMHARAREGVKATVLRNRAKMTAKSHILFQLNACFTLAEPFIEHV
jgi:hypothetical protein